MLVLRRNVGEEVFVDGGALRVVVDGVDETGLVQLSVWAGDLSLAIKRRKGEWYLFGQLEIVVLFASRRSVRLGFVAPKSVIIDREEVHLIRTATRWSLAHAE